MNHISDQNKKVLTEKTSYINNYEKSINPKSYDEEKLFGMMDQCTMITSKVKWIHFRDEFIQHIMSSEECSLIFYEKFIKLVKKIDPIYFEEQEELLQFLSQIVLWKKNDLKNIDIVINRFSILYEKSNKEKNETMTNHLKFLTQNLLKFIIDKHGTSVIFKLRNSFEIICEKTHDNELLYILWTKLFER